MTCLLTALLCAATLLRSAPAAAQTCDDKPPTTGVALERLTEEAAVAAWRAEEKPSPTIPAAKIKKLKEDFWNLLVWSGEKTLGRCRGVLSLADAKTHLTLPIRTVFDRDEYLRNQYGMSFEEYVALMWYTGDGYMCINQAFGTENESRFKPAIELINSALARLPDFKGKAKNGLNLSPEQQKDYVPSAVISRHYYTSATLDSDSDFLARRDIFTITSKHGKALGNISFAPGEKEVLFPPHTRFKVLFRKGPSKLPDGTDRYEYELEEVE